VATFVCKWPTFFDGRRYDPGDTIEAPSLPGSCWTTPEQYRPFNPGAETVAAGGSTGFLRSSTAADPRRQPGPRGSSLGDRPTPNVQRAVEVAKVPPGAWRF